MTILVTGGAGYIGSHFLYALIDSGYTDFVVIDNLSTGSKNAIPPDVDFFHINAGDRSKVQQIIAKYKVDTIVHFAGSTVVPESVENPLKYYLNNTSVSRDIIQCAADCHVKNFVFSSTAAVYGDVDFEPIGETHPTNPASPYGRSKLMTETMLTDVSKATGLKFAILRYFNVAGADPLGRTGQRNPRATHLVKRALMAATGQLDSISIFGDDYPTQDGTAIRDFIHVSDLAQAHVAALKFLDTSGSSIIANCGYGKGTSVLDIINAVKSISGEDFSVDTGKRRPGDVASVIADPSLILQEFDWSPVRQNIEDIVADAFAWEKQMILEESFDVKGLPNRLAS